MNCKLGGELWTVNVPLVSDIFLATGKVLADVDYVWV
jgi:hypothetical protein